MLGVADARFSGGTRYRKPPPTVRGVSSERRTGKGLFLSGICRIRCRQCSPFSGSLKNSVPERAFYGTEYARGAKKQASVVRGAFSEAFGVKNRLLRYGRDVRYRKRTPMVRGCIFRAPYRRGHLPFWHLLYSVQAMLFFFWQFEKFGTGEGLLWYGICARCKKQASVVRDAF